MIAGTICVPWSQNGKRKMWIHDSTLLFLLWLRGVVLVDPDAVVHECTPSFDIKTVQNMQGRKWRIHDVTFCTSDMGVPVRRRRKYSLIINISKVTTVLSWTPSSFQELAGRKMMVDSSIYFRAPDTLVAAFSEEFASKRGKAVGLPLADMLAHSHASLGARSS